MRLQWSSLEMNIEHMRNKYNLQREKGTMEEGKSKREEKPNESERHRSNSSETRGWRGKCAFPMRVNYRKGEDKRREKMGTTPQRFLLPFCVGGFLFPSKEKSEKIKSKASSSSSSNVGIPDRPWLLFILSLFLFQLISRVSPSVRSLERLLCSCCSPVV